MEKALEVEANKYKKRSAAARKKDEFINRNLGGQWVSLSLSMWKRAVSGGTCGSHD